MLAAQRTGDLRRLTELPGKIAALTLQRAERGLARGRVVHLVRGDHEHVADIVPDGALEELEDTVEVLTDSEAVRALIEAREAAARGDVVRGVDAVRALLDERRD